MTVAEPESTAPESTAPESTAPESTAPESTAPESTAPESTETTTETTAEPAAQLQGEISTQSTEETVLSNKSTDEVPADQNEESNSKLEGGGGDNESANTHKRELEDASDAAAGGDNKKIHVEIEKPAVDAGHGYLKNMDITSMSYEEYLTEFKALQDRSKAKFNNAQQQLRQLQQQHRQQHQNFPHQNRMNPQHNMMNFNNGNGNMPHPPMMGGPMGGPPLGGPPMGNMHHMGMGMGPGPPMGGRW